MYGLPSNVDLDFLRGKELQLVCIGRHQVILHFDERISISIESEFAHKGKDGEVTRYTQIIASSLVLANLINASIIRAVARDRGTLVLEFSCGDVLEIYDSNPQYESYQITHDEKTIVV